MFWPFLGMAALLFYDCHPFIGLCAIVAAICTLEEDTHGEDY